LIEVLNMKVKFTKRSKEITKVSELPNVNEVIKYFKEEEEGTGGWYYETAARVASGWNMEIIKGSAEIARNARAWDKYGNSADFDVWCDVYAFNPTVGFYDIGFYVSDLWELTSDNADEIKSRMYIGEYKAQR
jgi:hypothetical protein